MAKTHYINNEKVTTAQDISENDVYLYLEGDDGLTPYLRMRDRGMPKDPINQIAWLLLSGSGCAFCKVCREEPCNISDGEKCTDNIANYIRDCVHKEDAEKMQNNQQEKVDDEILIWRYRISFLLGKGIPIATKIKLSDYETISLNKNFKAVVIESGCAKGVYELYSGCYAGATIAETDENIKELGDDMIIKIQDAAKIRDTAKIVSNDEFGIK